MSSARKRVEPRQSAFPPWWAKNWLPALLLLLAVLVVYWPAMHGGFLWDDAEHISENRTLTSLKGLWAIWSKPGETMQYYPLTFSVWWVALQKRGLNPAGYHLLTVLLHGCASILLWQVLERLRVRGAWLAGAIFALHPVNVMSVAWMTELKNTLSASLALGAAWAYLRFARLGVYADANEPNGRHISPAPTITGVPWRWYFLAFGLFALGLLAKTAVSFLPVTLLLIVWWQRQRLGWREVWPVLPMLALVPLFGVATIWVERQTGAVGEPFSLSFLERALISGRSFWFYLGKLFFPHPLIFIYERWAVDVRAAWQYVFPLSVAALFAGLWWWRERVGQGIFVALLHFYVATSLLVLGHTLYMTRFAFVSDHWQYFGCLSVAALTAAGIVRVTDSNRFARLVICGPLLLVLGILTWRQCGMYRDVETLWLETLEKNPACWMAHTNLGVMLESQGKPEEAIQHYHEALRLNPNYTEAHYNLGRALATQGKLNEAAEQFERALQLQPNYVSAHFNLGFVLATQGKWKEAIEHYERALGPKSNNAKAHYQLGVALARLGKLKEARQHFQQALNLATEQGNAWLVEEVRKALKESAAWPEPKIP